jgi:hypothetical protein
MSVRLGPNDPHVLRWWWEQAPEGQALELRTAVDARAAIRAASRAGDMMALRRLLAVESGFSLTRLDDDEVLARLASEIAAGRVLVTREPLPVLIKRDGDVAEEAPVIAEPVRAEEPAPVEVEEECEPCKGRAPAQQAEALRDAARDGLPFCAAS